MPLVTHAPIRSEHLPHAFKLVHLQLAREPKFPNGSSDYGYRLIVPLDNRGRIDPVLWKAFRDHCKVVRFKPHEADEVGHLIRKGKIWAFHYDVQGNDADDTGYRLGTEPFEIGEYVSVREHGTMHTFKVTSVEPAGH